MVPGRMATRAIRVLAMVGLSVPLMMGNRCLTPPPIATPSPVADDNNDQDNGGDALTPALVVSAGVDRTATAGYPIRLQGAVSGGDENYSITWEPASLLSDTRSLSPNFQTNTEGDFQLTLLVTDGSGATASDSMTVSVSRVTTLGSLQWGVNFPGEGYQVIAAFSKALDKSTAERVANYRITGTQTNPRTATLDTDQRTVILVFSSGALTRETAFDISVEGNILDANGANVPQTRGLVPSANADDTAAPTLPTIRWAVNHSGSYAVELVFSESMDRTSVESAATYRIHNGTAMASAFGATLGNDGRTVTVIFKGLPLAGNATIDIGLALIRDINGQRFGALAERTIATNRLDVDPPTIVDDGVRFVGDLRDGYKISVKFNESMDQNTAEDATLYGLDGRLAASATLGTDGRTVTLFFDVVAADINSVLAITGGAVKDINGLSLPVQNDLAILPAAGIGAAPSVPVLTWLAGEKSQGYQFLARFNEAMDTKTVETVTNWRISETRINPNSVVLSTRTSGDEIAGRTALVTFDDFNKSDKRLSRTSRIDVSVGDSILDVEGNALAESTLPVLPNSNDAAAPLVVAPPEPRDYAGPELEAQPVWGDISGWDDLTAVTYDGIRYHVSVLFGETMDAESAGSRANYLLTDAGIHPTAVTVNGSPVDAGPATPPIAAGRLVHLEFEVTEDGVAITDQLRILSSVRDINGRPTASVIPLSISANPADFIASSTDPPVIAQDDLGNNEIFWGIDKGPYEVVVQFDMVMDRTTATNVNHYALNGTKPTSARLSSNGKAVSLVFGNGTFQPVDQLVIAPGKVTNVNGVPFAGIAAPGALVRQKPTIDTEHPELEKVQWVVDPVDYRLVATFTEAIDAFDAETVAYYALTAFYAPIATNVTLLPGGKQVEVLFPATQEKGVLFSAQLVSDMHGNWAPSFFGVNPVSKIVTPNPNDFAAVPMPLIPGTQATWAANYNMGGYALTVTFSSEVLDRRSAEIPEHYRFQLAPDLTLFPTQVNLAGVDVPPLIFAGRTVTLWIDDDLFTSVVEGWPMARTDRIDISPGSTIMDLNGNLFTEQRQIMVRANPFDTIPPTVVSALDLGNIANQYPPLPGKVQIVFSEAMDRTSVETLANYILDPLDVAAAPIGAELGPDGMTALVQFPVTVLTGRSVRVSVGNTISDINGRMLVEIDFGL